MKTFLFLLLLVAGLSVVFAIQNPGNVRVVVGPYGITTPHVLYMVFVLGLGFVFGLLASLSRRRKYEKVD